MGSFLFVLKRLLKNQFLLVIIDNSTTITTLAINYTFLLSGL